MLRRTAVVLILLLACGCATAPDVRPSPPVPPPDFPDDLVLRMLDREALYTVAGGLKPVSSGFWQADFDVSDPDLSAAADLRRALAVLRCDDYWADVMPFAAEHDGRRFVEAYVVHRRALAETIGRQGAFFSAWGILPDTHPAEVLAVVERLPALDRFRGYGYLFGYPDAAVDFFVTAAAHEAVTGDFVPRVFVQIPTFEADTGRFVYAVAQDHTETADDYALYDAAAAVLAEYRVARERRLTHDDVRQLLEDVKRMDAARCGCCSGSGQ